MAIPLVVTAKGQVNLCKEVLDHLEVRPGNKLEVHLLKGGRVQVIPKRETSVASLFGILARPGTPRLSVDGIN